ncbi:MAG TPA: hypothetical protein PLY93_03975 [Turneriella sp.]|nr:hypothetical protein [Turneriella sp.]
MPKTLEADVTDMVKPYYERGLERGIEKGLKRGIEKTKLETARRMFAKGLSLHDILEITGLSPADLRAAGLV